jgi:hypothetical protein
MPIRVRRGGEGAGCRGLIRRSRGFAAGVPMLEACEARVLLAFNPTAQEQYMLELLNHLRADPQANLDLMTSSLGSQARSSDPDIDSALQFFHVNGTALAQEFAALTPVAPVAWNEDLYESAAAHTQVMIDTNSQTHQAPGEPDLGDRATNAGYVYSTLGENVYAFAESTFHGHAGFAIDWGNGPNGIQDPPGHLENMMNGAFREVGIRILSENNSSTQVGPLVITQDFGNRFSFGNPFLMGVVFGDLDGDSQYDVGEGLGNVTISVMGAAGTYIATSMDAGGYQVKVPAGIYDITFSGAGFGSSVTYRNVTVSSQNVKVDGVKGVSPPQPDIAVFGGVGNGVEIAFGDNTPSTTDWTDFGAVNLAQTLTRTFTIRNTGGASLQLTTFPRVTITGTGAGLFTLVSDAGASLLAHNEQTTFSVRFNPVDTKSATVTVTIVSDDPDEGGFTFQLKARGQNAPDIDLSGGTGAVAILDGDMTPSLADGTGFNTVNVANRTKAKTFTITNSGSRAITLGSSNGSFVIIGGTNAADFRLISQPTNRIEPGASTTFRIRFNPSAEGARNAVLVLLSNDPDESTFEFAVRGQGLLAPIVQVWGLGEQIVAGALPSTSTGTQFGDAAVDGGAVLRTFEIRNIGSAALTLRSTKSARAQISGASASQYRVSIQPASATLAVGGVLTFRVRFDPTQTGAKLASVVLDTINGGVFTFNIAGTGV